MSRRLAQVAGIGMATDMVPNAGGASSTSGSGWRQLVLQPAVTCEMVNSPYPGAILPTVNASVNTNIGIVRSSWHLHSCPTPSPAPGPGAL